MYNYVLLLPLNYPKKEKTKWISGIDHCATNTTNSEIQELQFNVWTADGIPKVGQATQWTTIGSSNTTQHT